MESIEVLPIRFRVTAILRKALLAGEYKPGEELSLTDIAAKLGVSRTPVREAFQSLASEGLLELRMNRGAVVTAIDESFIRDHFELRILLESEAAALAAVRCSDFSTLEKLQEQAENRTGIMDDAEYRSYNQKYHNTIWRAAGNRKMYDLLCTLWNGPSSSKAGRDPDHESMSIREHRQILRYLLDGNSEGARSAMQAHIARSMENILKGFRASHTDVRTE